MNLAILPKEYEHLRKILDETDYLKALDHFSMDIKLYKDKDNFRTKVSWHVPTVSLISLLVKSGPIVSVGCGNAFTESQAISQGADIICTDLTPPPNLWCPETAYTNVEQISAEDAVEKYNDRTVFMAWPPYNTSMAYDVVQKMKSGQKLIYIGEGDGGCTGDDNFFNSLYDDFESLDHDINIKRWVGIYDYVKIFIKK